MFSCLFYRLCMQDMDIKQQFKIAAAFRLFPGLVEICKNCPAQRARVSFDQMPGIARRYNLALGISDEAAFYIADAALSPAAMTLTMMPGAILAASLAVSAAHA